MSEIDPECPECEHPESAHVAPAVAPKGGPFRCWCGCELAGEAATNRAIARAIVMEGWQLGIDGVQDA